MPDYRFSPGALPIRGVAIGFLPLRQLVLALLFLTLLIALAAAMIGPLAAIGRHVSFNANEGWNAYWAERALAGAPLYTYATAPITNNYPPLSFYFVGWFGRLLGDTIVAGRIICLVALLGSGMLVERVAVAVGGSRRWGIAVAICLLLFVAAAAPVYVAANDPQWLAELPMLAALWVLVRRAPADLRPADLAAASALMLASGLVKPTGLALPLATTLWLAVVNRRALGLWLMFGAAGGLLALVWLDGFGPTALGEIVRHERVMHLALLRSAIKTLTPLAPAIAIMLTFAGVCRRRPLPGDARVWLVLGFTALALILGILARFGTGTAQNVHFDTAIGLFIVAGVALSRGERRRHPLLASRWRIATFALLLLPLVGALLVRDRGAIARVTLQDDAERDWARAIGFIRARRGDVACERAALCYWAGKRFVLDFSNYGQKLRYHDPAGIGFAIGRQNFAAIISVRDERYRAFNSRLPLAFNKLIERNYRVRQALPDNIYLLVPRR